ncbi:MAG: hypothetical protein GXO74_13335 [Calditrichaeota bacterium]|nr:hypothetical protein [Calditrichota bacterium]
MRECPRQNLIVDFVFHEMDGAARKKFEEHLNNCDICQMRLQQFEGTIPVIKKMRRDQPEKNILENYQKTLKNSFYPKLSLRWRLQEWLEDFFVTPSLSMRLAQAAAMLVIGVLLGRLFFFQPQAPVSVTSNANQMIAANVSDQLLQHYLQETEMILLDVANTNPAEDAQMISSMKELAIYRRLLQKTVLCRERAEELKDPALANLIDEIELIFLDLCNAEDESLNEMLQHVRSQIKDSHILLEINTVEQRGI